MIKILFVCHGNICRSPMAEFIMKDLLFRTGISSQFEVASAATSREEIGNPVHPGTSRKLAQFGISCAGKYARQMTKADYQHYDYLIGMDQWNICNMMRILGSDPDGKVFRLLDFAGREADIADPWYTGDFDKTFKDVYEGCQALLMRLKPSLYFL